MADNRNKERKTKHHNEGGSEWLTETNKGFWKVQGRTISMKKHPPDTSFPDIL
jgi:hypothetical protein